jgi:hypothetical protein
MLITLLRNIPGGCAFCGEPFRRGQENAEIWRSTTGQYFCSEFCADDAEEASFQNKRKQLTSSSTIGTDYGSASTRKIWAAPAGTLDISIAGGDR